MKVRLTSLGLELFSFCVLYWISQCAHMKEIDASCPWNCTCLGNTVDCSQKVFVMVPNQLPSWIEVLDLALNNIESTNNLGELYNLKEVNLNGNSLIHGSFNFCSSLSQLSILKLSNVSLVGSAVVSAESYLPCNVTSLYLSYNQLKDIGKVFLTNFPKVSLLDLSHNNFSSLDNSSLPSMPLLEILYLDDNVVDFISKEYFDLVPNLEVLKMNGNKIQFLKKEFFQLRSLKILELESNKLTVIEGLTFKGLEHLLCLKLRRNFINHLMDGSFWGLSSIQSLDLSGNNISSIHNRWLYGLESLQQLSLAHNKIEIIEEDAWKFSRNITDLNLRYNKLTTLSEISFKQLNLLKRLQLQHNNIAYISDSVFHHLTSLKSLDLGYNNLSWTLDDSGAHFDHLISLTRLVLEHNKIKSLSKRLFNDLSALKHLNIAGKSLASIQARAFENIVDLRYFNMDSENLLCDCQLVWTFDWLLKFKFEVYALCGYPETMKGKKLLDLQRDDLKCISFSRPVITQEPQSIKALLHGNATLTCIAASAGKSSVHIQWKKDNIALRSSDYKEIITRPTPLSRSSSGTSIMQVISQVVMHPVVDLHAGRYQCIATNVIGSTYSVKALVTVNVFPSFVKTPSPSIVVRAGATARIDCSATGLPTPVIALQKDGGDDFPAARERRMHIYPSDERFFIVNIKMEDQGTYTCSASNPVGVISFNTTLQVLEPPKFIRRMEINKTSLEGETTVFECLARGSPRPKIEWLKDLKPVIFTLRHFSTGESQFLIIVQTDKEDEGEYSCIISNTLGSEKQTVYLSVVKQLSNDENIIGASLWHAKEDHSSTTAGVIVIAVVCCVVGTSLAWACIIYTRTRQSCTKCSFSRHYSKAESSAVARNIKWKQNELVKQLSDDNHDVSTIILAKHCTSSRNQIVSRQNFFPCDTCTENRHFHRQRNDSGTHTLGSNYSSLAKSEINSSPHHCAAVFPDSNLTLNPYNQMSLSSSNHSYPNFVRAACAVGKSSEMMTKHLCCISGSDHAESDHRHPGPPSSPTSKSHHSCIAPNTLLINPYQTPISEMFSYQEATISLLHRCNQTVSHHVGN